MHCQDGTPATLEETARQIIESSWNEDELVDAVATALGQERLRCAKAAGRHSDAIARAILEGDGQG